MTSQTFPGDPTLRSTAEAMDREDPLAPFRERFFHADPDQCYLDGNSLGKLPLATIDTVSHFLTQEWGTKLVGGWSEWIDQAQTAGDLLARAILGTGPGQTLVCDTTSVNFYQLAVAAVTARPGRKTVIMDSANFPTDRYIIQGICERFGLTLITLDTDGSAAPGSLPVDVVHERMTVADLAPFLTDDVALVTLQAINYRAGSRPELEGISRAVKDAGALMLWDCSHAGGAIALDFDAAGIDLAVGCTYKYGNSGPGSPAWLFVWKELQDELNVPIQGWFAQRDQFVMGPEFDKATDMRAFQIASPSIIGIRGVEASYSMIEEAGIEAIEHKAAAGTELMIALVDAWLAPLGASLGTPREASHRGGHIIIHHPDAAAIAHGLREISNVIPDYREPDAIRLAISPLPTSFTEVWDGFDRLRRLIESGEYTTLKPSGKQSDVMPEHDKAVTYTTYLKVEELLSLQEPLSDGPEHDELLFITIHQVYELWFQQILHELAALQPALEAGDTHRSLALLSRVRTIMKTCVAQIDVLETMTPLQFSSFRSRLSSASGFQSAQFRELEAVLGRRDHAGAGAKEGSGMKMAEHLVPGSSARLRVEAAMDRASVWHSALRYCDKRGHRMPQDALECDVSLPWEAREDVQQVLIDLHHNDPESAMVCEALVDFDEGLGEWRYRHVKMVERTLGKKIGSGGSSGVGYLAATLFNPVFPDLWDMRSKL